METLEALAVRLEQASEADQLTMLEQAFTALHPGIWLPAPGSYWPPIRVAFARMLEVEAFESAAMTLVPEGRVFNCGNDAGPCWAHIWKDDPQYDGRPVEARGSTPALALCAAALRAHLLAQKDHTPS